VVVVGKLAEKLPDSAGRIAIVDESQLETAQTLTRVLRSVANWMWLLALVVAALAVWLAKGRRRIELRALAIGVLLVGLLMLAARRAGGNYVVDHLAKDDSAKPAARDAWSILTQTLVDRAWVWIILGAMLLLGVWFVGNTGRASKIARRPTASSRQRCSSSHSSLHCSLAVGLPRSPSSSSQSSGSRSYAISWNEKHSRRRRTPTIAAGALPFSGSFGWDTLNATGVGSRHGRRV
jgi:hypothetical protein